MLPSGKHLGVCQESALSRTSNVTGFFPDRLGKQPGQSKFFDRDRFGG